MKRRSLLGAFAAAPLLAQEETGRRPRGMPPLKITDVKAVNAEGYIFYRVYTDGGVTGVGEPSPSNGPLNVTFVEMLKPLITGMEILFVVAVAAVALSMWHDHETSASSSDQLTTARKDVAIVGRSPSASAIAESAPSDTSIPEAA